jgi:phosphoribosylaminoimidazole-succinocarboxamide synthase
VTGPVHLAAGKVRDLYAAVDDLLVVASDRVSAGRDRRGEPPAIPPEIVEQTRSPYVEAYERITGLSFADRPGGAR